MSLNTILQNALGIEHGVCALITLKNLVGYSRLMNDTYKIVPQITTFYELYVFHRDLARLILEPLGLFYETKYVEVHTYPNSFVERFIFTDYVYAFEPNLDASCSKTYYNQYEACQNLVKQFPIKFRSHGVEVKMLYRTLCDFWWSNTSIYSFAVTPKGYTFTYAVSNPDRLAHEIHFGQREKPPKPDDWTYERYENFYKSITDSTFHEFSLIFGKALMELQQGNLVTRDDLLNAVCDMMDDSKEYFKLAATGRELIKSVTQEWFTTYQLIAEGIQKFMAERNGTLFATSLEVSFFDDILSERSYHAVVQYVTRKVPYSLDLIIDNPSNSRVPPFFNGYFTEILKRMGVNTEVVDANGITATYTMYCLYEIYLDYLRNWFKDALNVYFEHSTDDIDMVISAAAALIGMRDQVMQEQFIELYVTPFVTNEQDAQNIKGSLMNFNETECINAFLVKSFDDPSTQEHLRWLTEHGLTMDLNGIVVNVFMCIETAIYQLVRKEDFCIWYSHVDDPNCTSISSPFGIIPNISFPDKSKDMRCEPNQWNNGRCHYQKPYTIVNKTVQFLL